MVGYNAFEQMPGMQEQLQKIRDRAKNQQSVGSGSLIGGGEGNRGIAKVVPLNPAGSLAQSAIPGGTLGAGGFAAAPMEQAAPELAAEVAPEVMSAAAAPDLYNNAIRTPQQDAVGQIQGNAFMRQRSMQGLV
tara:strand:- start:458 stop:856 length:399 start_codon:yes stop_codon:yes gene_type:complete